jgi:hypothetical protein
LECFLPARALCFAWRLDGQRDRDDLTLLSRAADLGILTPSRRWRAGLGKKTATGWLLQRRIKASAMDFIGWGYTSFLCSFTFLFFFFPSSWQYNGVDCAVNLIEARLNFFRAAERGDVDAMGWLSEWFRESTPAISDPWYWKLKGFFGHPDFLREFPKQVHSFNTGFGSFAVVFAIGHALKGHIDFTRKRIFDSGVKNAEEVLPPAIQADKLYDAQIKACRKAIDTWTLVGVRHTPQKAPYIYITPSSSSKRPPSSTSPLIHLASQADFALQLMARKKNHELAVAANKVEANIAF